MRTETTTLFQFQELTEEAQQQAIENYRNKGCDQSHYYG